MTTVSKLFVYHPHPESNSGLLADLKALDKLAVSHGSNLAEIPTGSLVIPRYRMLPFGRELEAEVTSLGSTLINSYREHRQVADLFYWVNLLGELTPPAYTLEDIHRLPEGAYFLKGETNSKKNAWFESAYAPDKASVMTIARTILADEWVGSQKLAIRPFQAYRQIGEAVNGRPVFHERRAFYLDGQLLSEAHYWNVNDFGAPEPLKPANYLMTRMLAEAAVGHLARFLVIDYAEYEDGTWGVVELNDGAMAGLSANSPSVLWGKLVSKLRNP